MVGADSGVQADEDGGVDQGGDLEQVAQGAGVAVGGEAHCGGGGRQYGHPGPYHYQQGFAGAGLSYYSDKGLAAHYAVALYVAQVEDQRPYEAQDEDYGEGGQGRGDDFDGAAPYRLRQKG